MNLAKISRYFLGACGLTLLSACASGLLPEPEPAPQLWQLALPQQVERLETAPPQANLTLAIERPLATAPLRSVSMWYSSEQQLTPFSANKWAQSLEEQMQQQLVFYFSQQPWLQASLSDQPGVQANYRLRLHLYEWHLANQEQQLVIALQANLLNKQGLSLWQHTWSETKQLQTSSPKALVAASQLWLENWLAELNQLLVKELTPN